MLGGKAYTTNRWTGRQRVYEEQMQAQCQARRPIHVAQSTHHNIASAHDISQLFISGATTYAKSRYSMAASANVLSNHNVGIQETGKIGNGGNGKQCDSKKENDMIVDRLDP